MKIESAEIRNTHHVPELYINGENVPAMMFGLSDIAGSKTNTHYAYTNIRKFAESGIHIVNIDTGIRICWSKSTGLDFTPVHEEILGVLDADPNACVLIRLHMNPPYWWMRDNPDEQIIYRTEAGDHPGIDNGEQLRFISNDGEKHMRVSYASEKWREESCEVLRQLCQSLDGTPEGDAIVGIQPAYGHCGEWHNFGVDVGLPMRRRFERYIREKYGTVDKLREAYHDDRVTFETAEFRPDPVPEEVEGMLLDPQKHQRLIDSRYVHQLSGLEAIEAFARTVKENFRRKILVGSFYSYFFCAGTDIVGAHCFTRELFDSGLVDFICGPAPYTVNRLPDGVSLQRGVLESCRVNGILWLTEMDQRPFGTEYYVGGDPARYDDSIAQMRRNILQPVIAGHGAWYYDHRIIQLAIENGKERKAFGSMYRKIGWWESDLYQNEIKKLYDLRLHRFDGGYRPAADVLVVVDTKKYFYAKRTANIEVELVKQLGESGAAYDCLYLDDLDLCETERYRCVFFMNTLYMNQEEKELIRSRFGHTAFVWFWLDGFSDGRTVSADNAFDLTGFRVTPSDTAREVRFGDTVFRPETSCMPRMKVETAEGDEIRAVYDNGDTAAVRRGNAYYYGFSQLPAEEVRRILRENGVWVYSEDCKCVFAGGGLLAVYNTKGGDCVLSLKNGRTIHEVFRPYTTAVYDSETGERLL